MFIDKKVLYPEEFKSAYIREYPSYENDLRELLERSGYKDEFCGKYKQRLMFLEEWNERCIQRRNWFERLKHVGKELYSMKFKTQKNIRILFVFKECKGVGYVILLYPFEEKNDKKMKGKDSYGAAIQIALKRLREVLAND